MPSDATAQALLRRHPLQRLDSPARGLSALLHAASLVSFAYNFRYLLITPNPVNESYGWHMQYLTIIGLSIASLSFTCGLIADITLSPRFFLLKNALSVCSAPLEVLISILYWGLRSIDPKLVLPEWAPLLATNIDLGFHLVPALVLTLDLLFFSPPWTIAAWPAVGLSSTIALLYWFWVELCYSHNGFYPYPIFAALTTPYRGLLFAGSAVTMAFSTWSLQWLYRVVNGREVLNARPKARPGSVKKTD